ncbi:MAG: hypothetical protein QOI73_3247 [Solirubrobacteraceae bacterium]|nr:hypothetical protein [Solirubrobacteraceae bacterium]
MRLQAASLGALGAFAFAGGAVAEAPVAPAGNLGGGALVSPPRDIFGPGNAIIAIRALPKRRLEIEATVRARCAGGDIAATAKVSAAGLFEAEGTATQEPSPALKVQTKYVLKGRFTAAGSAEGTISATIERTLEGSAQTCKSGTVTFAVRRPTTGVGSPGAPKAARYYGTTSQRGTGPSRPIVLRVASDGRRLTRGLFGESVKCDDGKLSIGVEAPRTNIHIDAHGRVNDREQFKLTEGETIVHVDDRFKAQLGSKGASGTFALSDRTTDRASGRTIQTCRSGTVHWRASR